MESGVSGRNPGVNCGVNRLKGRNSDDRHVSTVAGRLSQCRQFTLLLLGLLAHNFLDIGTSHVERLELGPVAGKP